MSQCNTLYVPMQCTVSMCSALCVPVQCVSIDCCAVSGMCTKMEYTCFPRLSGVVWEFVCAESSYSQPTYTSDCHNGEHPHFYVSSSITNGVQTVCFWVSDNIYNFFWGHYHSPHSNSCTYTKQLRGGGGGVTPPHYPLDLFLGILFVWIFIIIIFFYGVTILLPRHFYTYEKHRE